MRINCTIRAEPAIKSGRILIYPGHSRSICGINPKDISSVIPCQICKLDIATIFSTEIDRTACDFGEVKLSGNRIVIVAIDSHTGDRIEID